MEGTNKNTIMIIVIVIISALCFYLFHHFTMSNYPSGTPIKVGVLHSISGTMAISETSVNRATLMAIEEINLAGGILGRPIVPVVVDGRSDWNYSAKMAEQLITQDKVNVVFGCWTSSCRKTVKPVFEKYNHLLIYPLQYEGLEQSPNIVYTGAAPNQQIIPAIKWAFDNIGKRFFLIGSDYIFPHTANAIIKDQVKVLGGEVVGEEYILLGSKDVAASIAKIVSSKPTVIINTINGDSNIPFFKALRQEGITPQTIPTISFSIAEDELLSLDVDKMVGDYASWNYFQSIDSKTNATFVQNYKKNFGSHTVTDDPIESAYFGVYLWAQAVKEANTEDVNIVREKIKKQSLDAPEGTVYVDPDNQHTWKTVRIGKIRKDGQFDIVWHSEKSIQPIPYPTYRSKAEWDKFELDLYKSWGNQWANPGK